MMTWLLKNRNPIGWKKWRKIALIVPVVIASTAYGRDVDQCSMFHNAQPDDSRIFVDPRGNLSPEFRFSRRYLTPNDFPEPTPAKVETFALHLETGLPVENYRSTPPQEYEHFQILLQYVPYVKPLNRMFINLGFLLWEEAPDEIVLHLLDNIADGYIGVEAPNTARTSLSNVDIALKFDQKTGTFGEAFLVCKQIGSVPNPSCSLYLNEQGFILDIYFNRKELTRVDRIEFLARRFVTCSITKGSEQ